jgi:hypothetical protein
MIQKRRILTNVTSSVVQIVISSIALFLMYKLRPETITIRTNELIGTDPTKLPPALVRLMAGQ